MLPEFSPSKELAKWGIDPETHQGRKAVGSQIFVSPNQSPLFEFQKCPSWGGKSVDLGIFEISLGWQIFFIWEICKILSFSTAITIFVT